METKFIYRQNLFVNIGCFNEEYTIYEDNELIKRLYKIGRFKIFRKPVTSSRRYNEHGILKLQLFFWKIHLMHRIYKTPKKTNNFYYLNKFSKEMKHIIIIVNGISGITTQDTLEKIVTLKLLYLNESDYFFSRTALMYIYIK